jgi:glutaredoxin-like protein NrdH
VTREQTVKTTVSKDKRREMTMQVTVYTTPTCPQCDMTKKTLTKGNVRYEVVDLSSNPEAMSYVKEDLGYTAAPVVVTDTGHWSGFRLGAIQNLIKQIHGSEAKSPTEAAAA